MSNELEKEIEELNPKFSCRLVNWDPKKGSIDFYLAQGWRLYDELDYIQKRILLPYSFKPEMGAERNVKFPSKTGSLALLFKKKTNDNFWNKVGVFASVIAAIAGIIGLCSCTDADATLETLHKAGFKEVQVKGWSPFSCDDKDFSSTAFEATNPTGDRVDGVVCCGLLFKSCTVRF